MTRKEEISDFKKRADEFNKGLYSDIASFKNGLIIILIVISLIMIFVYF